MAAFAPVSHLASYEAWMHVLMLLVCVCVLFVSLCLIEQLPYEPVLYFQSLTVHEVCCINRSGSVK